MFASSWPLYSYAFASAICRLWFIRNSAAAAAASSPASASATWRPPERIGPKNSAADCVVIDAHPPMPSSLNDATIRVPWLVYSMKPLCCAASARSTEASPNFFPTIVRSPAATSVPVESISSARPLLP